MRAGGGCISGAIFLGLPGKIPPKVFRLASGSNRVTSYGAALPKNTQQPRERNKSQRGKAIHANQRSTRRFKTDKCNVIRRQPIQHQATQQYVKWACAVQSPSVQRKARHTNANKSFAVQSNANYCIATQFKAKCKTEHDGTSQQFCGPGGGSVT
eukprot:7314254-Pyramimonas_sp.AAC.3